MPDPPLSPTPRRWHSSSDSPHPDFASLLSAFETTSIPDESKSLTPVWTTPKTASSKLSLSNGKEEGTVEGEYTTASEHAEVESDMPDIRTISQSPQKSLDSKRLLRPLSPLLPPGRTQILDDNASAIGSKASKAHAAEFNSRESCLHDKDPATHNFGSAVGTP